MKGFEIMAKIYLLIKKHKVYSVFGETLSSDMIVKVSSNKKVLKNYINACNDRDPMTDIFEIKELEEYDTSYLYNLPKQPIYKAIYKLLTDEFISYTEDKKPSIIKLSYPFEEAYIQEHGECKCIHDYASNKIHVYVRADNEDEALIKIKESLSNYLEHRD